MKVYIVGDGVYSDYGIRGIFSTKEKAMHAKEFWHTDIDIEEIELDSLPEHPLGCFMFQVLMDRNGCFIHPNRGAYSGFPDSGVQRCSPDDRWGDSRCTALKDHWVFWVWARDEKHAIKIANERRTALIAAGKWGAQ